MKVRGTLLAAMLAFGMGSAALAEDEALFEYDGKKYGAADLPPALSHSHFDLELEHHLKLQNFVDAAVLDMHISDLMKKGKKTREQVEDELFKVKDPSDADVKKWYEENKGRLPPGYTLDQIKNDIVMLLKSEAKKKARAEVVEKVKKAKKVKFNHPKPVAPQVEIATAGYPTKGSDKAKVTIVEFADYQCPHCKAAGPAITAIMKKYGDKVRLVFMDFPINRSGVSTVVAHGAVCADEQGKYWPYHEKAFEDQRGLKKESPMEIAKDLKLDTTKFDACMKSNRPAEKVAKSKAEGERVGVSGTPAIYVNGRRIHGYEEAELTEAIDFALTGSASH